MSRIHQVQPQTAAPEARQLLDAVKAKLGVVPNLTKALANSPAALNSYLQFSGALSSGVLPQKTRELIAIAVAQVNSCDYCLAAHCAIGKRVGLTSEQIQDGRHSRSTDPKTDAILHFVRAVVVDRGQVTDTDIQTLRNVGVTDAELSEIVANVALNIFTNYFNHVAGTDIDFPLAQPLTPTQPVSV